MFILRHFFKSDDLPKLVATFFFGVATGAVGATKFLQTKGGDQDKLSSAGDGSAVQKSGGEATAENKTNTFHGDLTNSTLDQRDQRDQRDLSQFKNASGPINIDTKAVLILTIGGITALAIFTLVPFLRDRQRNRVIQEARRGHRGYNEFLQAVVDNDLNKIKEKLHINTSFFHNFIHPKIDINSVDNLQNNALMLAIEKNHENCGLLLLSQANFNLKNPNSKGESIFSLAILYCRYYILRELLQKSQEFHVMPDKSINPDWILEKREIPFLIGQHLDGRTHMDEPEKLIRRQNLFRLFFFAGKFDHKIIQKEKLLRIIDFCQGLVEEIILAWISTYSEDTFIPKLKHELNQDQKAIETELENKKNLNHHPHQVSTEEQVLQTKMEKIKSLMTIIRTTQRLEMYKELKETEIFSYDPR